MFFLMFTFYVFSHPFFTMILFLVKIKLYYICFVFLCLLRHFFPIVFLLRILFLSFLLILFYSPILSFSYFPYLSILLFSLYSFIKDFPAKIGSIALILAFLSFKFDGFRALRDISALCSFFLIKDLRFFSLEWMILSF